MPLHPPQPPDPASGVKAPCRQFTCLGTRKASASVYFSFQGRCSPLCNAQHSSYRASKTLPRSRRERRIRGLHKLRSPPNPIRESCCVQVRCRGEFTWSIPQTVRRPITHLKLGKSAGDITSLHLLPTFTQKQSTNHETLPNPPAPHLGRAGCAELGPSPFNS